MKNYFSQNLKFLREKAGVNQSQIAIRVKKGHTTIGNWEKGNNEPNFNEIRIIANFFEITEAELLFSDLTKGKLNEDESNAENSEKGKLKGKPIGKLKGKKEGEESSQDRVSGACKECERKAEKILQKDMIIRALTSTLKAQEDTISALKLAAKLQEERIPEKQAVRRKAG